MERESGRIVALRWEGKDHHEMECECGDCNTRGHAYAVALIDVTAHVSAVETPEELGDLLHDLDPVVVACGPSEGAAEREARWILRCHGWREVTDAEIGMGRN